MARDRTIHNDVVSDVAWPARSRRGEVLNGIERRRRWPDETRISIVAEALEPGAIVSHVARRHDLNPSQLFGWLKQYRAEALASRVSQSIVDVPTFASAVLDATALATSDAAPTPASPSQSPVPEPASIQISIGSATVRIHGAADAKTLAIVLKSLKVLA
jgi:transposase